MPYRYISPDLKKRAVFLTEPPGDYFLEDVAPLLGVSRSSIYRWKANMEIYGTVDAPREVIQGRPPMLSGEQVQATAEMLVAHPEAYLKEVQEWIQIVLDIPIARTTVWELIHSIGMTHKKLKMVSINKNPEAIQAFRDEWQASIPARMIVCSDETAKNGFTLRRSSAWGMRGQDVVQRGEIVRGDHYSLLPAMTIKGYIAKRVILGAVTASAFLEFFVEDVVCPFPLIAVPRQI